MVIWAICVIDPLKPSCHSFRSSGVLAKALGREVLLEQQPCHAAFCRIRWSTHDVEDLQISKGSAVTALRLQECNGCGTGEELGQTLPSEKVSKNQWLQRQSGQPRCLQSEKLGTEELDGIQNLVGNDLSVNSLLSLARDWSCDKGFIVVVVVLFLLKSFAEIEPVTHSCRQKWARNTNLERSYQAKFHVECRAALVFFPVRKRLASQSCRSWRAWPRFDRRIETQHWHRIQYLLYVYIYIYIYIWYMI